MVTGRGFSAGGGGDSVHQQSMKLGAFLPQEFFLRFCLTIDFSISNINILNLDLGGGGGGGGGESQFPPLYETLTGPLPFMWPVQGGCVVRVSYPPPPPPPPPPQEFGSMYVCVHDRVDCVGGPGDIREGCPTFL